MTALFIQALQCNVNIITFSNMGNCFHLYVFVCVELKEAVPGNVDFIVSRGWLVMNVCM